MAEKTPIGTIAEVHAHPTALTEVVGVSGILETSVKVIGGAPSSAVARPACSVVPGGEGVSEIERILLSAQTMVAELEDI